MYVNDLRIQAEYVRCNSKCQLNFGYMLLDVGCRIQDTRCRIMISDN